MGASLENGEEEDCTAKLPFFPKTLGGSQLPKSNLGNRLRNSRGEIPDFLD
jgi:hypothetical protein